jgi:hypothetical protein
MAPALLAAALALLVVDAALRLGPRRRGGGDSVLHGLVYLGLAYGPLLAVPRLPPLGITAVAGAVALGAVINFVRLVGLRHDLAFAVPVYALVPVAFLAAHAGPPWLFHALPVLAVVALLGPGVLRGSPHAFLQKVCLGWVAFLVYGYAWGHAAFLGRAQPLVVALLILLAKFADVAWVAASRLWPGRPSLQLVASPLGGAVGGALATALGGDLPPGRWSLLGAMAGFVLGLASRGHDLIVSDVTDAGGDRAARAEGRPLKSTMLFGFGLVLAVVLPLQQWLAAP